MQLRGFVSAMVGPALFATRAFCFVDAAGAIDLFNGLRDKANEVRIAANNLPPIACIQNNGYEVSQPRRTFISGSFLLVFPHIDLSQAVAGEVDELNDRLALVAAMLEGSTRLAEDDAVSQPVFDAFYGYSLIQRRFLAALATKSCLPSGVLCAILPTPVRTQIRTAIVTLKDSIEVYMSSHALGRRQDRRRHRHRRVAV
ncbi:hypothetical protein V8F20_001525 [Naviculisporaceae sp. PSN 640]